MRKRDTLTSQDSAHECYKLFLDKLNMLFTDPKSFCLNDSLVSSSFNNKVSLKISNCIMSLNDNTSKYILLMSKN